LPRDASRSVLGSAVFRTLSLNCPLVKGSRGGVPSAKEVSKGCAPFYFGIWDIFQKCGNIGFEKVLDEVYRGQRRIAGGWERKSALGDFQESNSKGPQIRADTVSMARDSLGLVT